MATFTFTLANAETYTTEAFQAAVTDEFLAFKARHESDETVIASAIHRLFDTYKGSSLNATYIQGQVTSALNVPPNADKEVRARVAAYMKAHTAVKETGKAPDGSDPLFINARGPKGGSARVSDIAVPTV